MTSYSDKGKRPITGEFLGVDHIHFWVGNAYQAAAYYICRFGFQPYAYRGLETGSRSVMTQVVRQNDIIFAFSSPLEPTANEINKHTSIHGDGVKEIAFRVTDCKSIYEYAISKGAKSILSPLHNDGIIMASIEAPYKDTWHTFIQRSDNNNNKNTNSNSNNDSMLFLPGFKKVDDDDPQVHLIPSPCLQFIDHCVVNQNDGEMESTVNWYIEKLQFHRFWSVDDKQLHTEYSSLRSIVICDYNERVKMPINEPASGKRKSQIQEFIEYYGGPGIQHIALNTNDILNAVARLKQRGVTFIKIPNTYYDDLKLRLIKDGIDIREDLSRLQKLGILVDFDNDGYLLQIFTKPVQDRPTLFLEVIQRYSNNGFGVGNFKSLFEAIEREQNLRGNS